MFTKNDPKNRIGRTYRKVVYRECEDNLCSSLKPHPKYLGVLGPIIRAEVGDKIVVNFVNKATRNYTVHPHGVFYTKSSEGALYEVHMIFVFMT